MMLCAPALELSQSDSSNLRGHDICFYGKVRKLITTLSLLPLLIWPHTFVSPSAFSRRAVVSYWRKYVHEVLVNPLGGLSLPRKSVVRLTDRPDMTLDVYRGRKTTNQQINPFLSKELSYCKYHKHQNV